MDYFLSYQFLLLSQRLWVREKEEKESEGGGGSVHIG